MFFSHALNIFAASGGNTILSSEADRRAKESISAGCNHTVVLQPDGRVATWGSNSHGQLGSPDVSTGSYSSSAVTVMTHTPGVPLQNIISVAAGCNFSLALAADGTVWTWGDNSSKQLGNNSTTSRNYPAQVEVSNGVNLGGIRTISAGDTWGLAIATTGVPYSWGDDSDGQLGRGSSGVTDGYAGAIRKSATQSNCSGTESNLNEIVAITGGPYQKGRITMMLSARGKVSYVGKNYPCPKEHSDSNNKNVISIAAGGDYDESWFHYIVKGDGTALSIGTNQKRQKGDRTTTDNTTKFSNIKTGTSTNLTNVTAITAGYNHGAAINASGEVYTWGSNNQKQTGQGTSSTYHPARAKSNSFTNLTAQLSLVAGKDFTIVRQADSTILGWGDNTKGQLGDNSTTERTYATSATSYIPERAFVQAVARANNVQLLRSDGTVWTAGSNWHGSLGVGTTKTDDSDRFKKVSLGGSGGSPARSLADGAAMSWTLGALDITGRPWAWGRKEPFAVGSGASDNGNPALQRTNSSTTMSSVKQFSIGTNLMSVINGSGAVYAAGLDHCGGTAGGGTNFFTIQSGGASDATSIASGDFHKTIRLANGEVKGCGINSSGQLGTGDNATKYTFTDVSNCIDDTNPCTSNYYKLFAAEYVSSGDRSTYVLRSYGDIESSGRNTSADLGMTGGNRLRTRVTRYALNNNVDARALAGGAGYSSAAIASDGTLVTWGLNSHNSYYNNAAAKNIDDLEKRGEYLNFNGESGTGNYTTGQLCRDGYINWSSSTNVWANKILSVMNISTLSMGAHSLVGIRANGTTFVCGSNPSGSNGNCSATPSLFTPSILGCRPDSPSSMSQNETSKDWRQKDSMMFTFTSKDKDDDESLTPWVEIALVQEAFTQECGIYSSTTFRGNQENSITANNNKSLTVNATGIPSGKYKWRACVTDSFGNKSDWTSSSEEFWLDTTIPAPPPNVIAAEVTAYTVTWEVTNSPEDAHSGLPASPYSFNNGLNFQTSKSKKISSLPANTEQTAEVIVQDKVGNKTDVISKSIVTLSANTPSLTSTRGWHENGDVYIDLNWTAPNGGASKYVIRDHNGEKVDETTETSIRVESLRSGESYRLRVHTVNSAGVENPSFKEVNLGVVDAPPPPTSISVSGNRTIHFVPHFTATRTRIVYFAEASCKGEETYEEDITPPHTLRIDDVVTFKLASAKNDGPWGNLSSSCFNGWSTPMAVSVDQEAINFGNLLPGNDVTRDSVISVTSNKSAGYSLKISMYNNFANVEAPSRYIPRISSKIGSPPGAEATEWNDYGFGMTVVEAPNLEPEWEAGSKWAQLPTSSTTITNASLTPTGSLQTTETRVRYRLKVPLNTPVGTYQGKITYTVTPIT